jgi:hypothetical protein
VLSVLEPALRMKAHAHSSSRGQKDFICAGEKRKTAWWGMQGDPETGVLLVRLEIVFFIAGLYIAPGWRCLSGAERGFLGRRGVSSTTYHLLGPPAVCPSIPLLNSCPNCCYGWGG